MYVVFNWKEMVMVMNTIDRQGGPDPVIQPMQRFVCLPGRLCYMIMIYKWNHMFARPFFKEFTFGPYCISSGEESWNGSTVP